jgi:hypothetical protein
LKLTHAPEQSKRTHVTRSNIIILIIINYCVSVFLSLLFLVIDEMNTQTQGQNKFKIKKIFKIPHIPAGIFTF